MHKTTATVRRGCMSCLGCGRLRPNPDEQSHPCVSGFPSSHCVYSFDEEGVEIVVDIDAEHQPVKQATFWDPPDGGCEAVYANMDGRVFTLTEVEVEGISTQVEDEAAGEQELYRLEAESDAHEQRDLYEDLYEDR